MLQKWLQPTNHLFFCLCYIEYLIKIRQGTLKKNYKLILKIFLQKGVWEVLYVFQFW